MKRFLIPVALFALALSTSAFAQPGGLGSTGKKRKGFPDLAKVTVEVSPKEAKPGETVQVKLTVTPSAGSWTYPTKPKDPNQRSTNSIDWSPKKSDLIFVGNVQDPPNPKTKPNEDNMAPPGSLIEYYTQPSTWILQAVVSPKTTPGMKQVPLSGVSLQVCDESVCIPSREKDIPAAEFTVLDSPATPVESQYATIVEKLLNPPAPAPPSFPPSAPPARGGPLEGPTPQVKEQPSKETSTDPHKKKAIPSKEYQDQLDAIAKTLDLTEINNDNPTVKHTGLSAFLLTAAMWGLISLVTPCVFPMIPITISIFMKQSHQSHTQTIKLATIYCLTIIIVLGVSAIALLKIFVDLSVSPWMNLFLGGLFVFFALSLFGMYDITLPNSLLRFTQSKQGAGGVVGTIFGALAFTIVSFTCVAPFLGGFAGMAASGNFTTFQLVLGGLAFATAFAFPFFLLALFPRLLKALPRSGGWLDSVKVVMGFLEVAAALKFFRTAEIGWESPTNYFTYDLVLGGWVAILFATGLYLLNAYRLPHDEEKPNIGVPRLVFALIFLGLAVYLTPALIKDSSGKTQRPGGVVYAWVDAFLLPDASVEFGVDLQSAMDRARAAKKPVFIDFTGQQCTNCRYNENSVFTKPQVWLLMSQFERVSLDAQFEVPSEAFYDPPSRANRGEESQINRDFKYRLTKNDQLPLYLILIPQSDGTWKVKSYEEGKINDVDGFKKFLQSGLPGKS